jgi:2Fe-2S iron-sulfur cluster binding domain
MPRIAAAASPAAIAAAAGRVHGGPRPLARNVEARQAGSISSRRSCGQYLETWSCRTGVCHTCESGLVSGEVGYAPDPLDDPADGDVLICCSRPHGDVALDL